MTTTQAPQTPAAPAPAAEISAEQQAGEVSAADATTRISVLREQIDAVDSEIIRLINERKALSHQVGRLRSAVGGPRLSISREHQIMGRFGKEIGAYGGQVALLLLKISRGRM